MKPILLSYLSLINVLFITNGQEGINENISTESIENRTQTDIERTTDPKQTKYFKESELILQHLNSELIINNGIDLNKQIEDSKKIEEIGKKQNNALYVAISKYNQAKVYLYLGFKKQVKTLLSEGEVYIQKVNDNNVKNILNAIYYNLQANSLSNETVKNRINYLFKTRNYITNIDNIYSEKNLLMCINSRLLADIFINVNSGDKTITYLNNAEQNLQLIHNNIQSAYFHYVKSRFEFLINKNSANALNELNTAEQYLALSEDLELKALIYESKTNIYKKNGDLENQLLSLENLGKTKNHILAIKKEYSKNLALSQNTVKENIWYKNDIIKIFFLLIFVLTVTYLVLKFSRERFRSYAYTSFFSKQKSQEGMRTNVISDLINIALRGDPNYYSIFLSVFPDFISKLQAINPSMNENEIEFCSLLKLQISTKQIAQLKKISVKSVESKKYRIRKKLNIPTDIDFYLWISKL